MTRTRRRRAWPVILAAVVMVTLLVGATALVSAGSAHHAHTPAASIDRAPAADAEVAGALSPAGHAHRHGNDWTPSPGQRLRPAAAGDSVVRAVPVGDDSLARPPVGPADPALSAPSDDGLALLGVLRV